MTNQPART